MVRATLLADDRQFKAGFKGAEDATDSFGKKAASVAKGIGIALAVTAVAAVGAFVADSKRAFSEFEQSTGAAEAVFGASADKITGKAKGAANEFGLSMAEFQSSAALLGSQLKNQLGLEVDEAAGKTTDLIGVAADLAAQFGGSTSEAVSAVGSLLRGERDPIERYAVSMNDAMITAKALEMGLGDATGALTAQDKAAASLAILYEQTGDAAGAFGREAETLAGKEQRLNAQLENNKVLVGQGIQGAYKLAMPVVGAFGEALADMSAAFLELTGSMSAADQVLRNISQGWDSATTPQEKFSDLIEEQMVQVGHWTTAVIDGEGAMARFVEQGVKGIDMLGLTTEELEAMRDQLPAIASNLDLTTEAEEGFEESLRQAIIKQKEQETQLAENKLRMEAMTGATEDGTTATDDATSALQRFEDEVRSQTDPLFALRDAEDDVAAAVRDVAAAEEEFKVGSPEWQAAVRDLARANEDLTAAQIRVAEEMGFTRGEFETHLRGMANLTEEMIQSILTDFDRANLYQFDPKTLTIRFGSGDDRRLLNLPRHHEGGVVAGPRGSDQLIVAKGGETVLPTHKSGVGGGSGTIININVTALDPNAAAKAVVQAIEIYKRNNGGRLPF